VNAASGSPIGSRQPTRHEEEAGHEQHARDADDEEAGDEGAQSGEIDQAGRHSAEAWVVTGGRHDWVRREQMVSARDVLQVAQVGVFVAEGECIRRGKDLDEVQPDRK
jgi:hypothetical protein